MRNFFSNRTLKLIQTRKTLINVVQDNKAIDFNKAPLDKDTTELVVDNYCNSNV